MKREIRRWWFAGFWVELFAFVASLMVPVLTGPGRILHGHTRLAVSLLLLCLLVALVGVSVQIAAWVKAVSNAKRLPDPKWHRRLLRWGIVGGLLTPLLGLGALICWWVMLDYLRYGPEEPLPIVSELFEPAASVPMRERV